MNVNDDSQDVHIVAFLHTDDVASTTAVVKNSVWADAATAPPPSLHDCSCPFCLELLLRPVVLSCGHHFCRGCWLRVLQGRAVRATAHLTGRVACPFRCEVRPVVPEVDHNVRHSANATF